MSSIDGYFDAAEMEVEDAASEVLDEIGALNSEKEYAEHKIRNEIFKVKLLEENTEKVRAERETVRRDYVRIKEELEYLSKADQYAVATLSAHRQRLKRMTGFLEMLKELGAESELDKKLAEGMGEAEQQSSSFSALLAQYSPWTVEKNRLKREFEDSETKLTEIYEKIGATSKKIAVIEDLTRGHRDVPFRKVCFSLAEYTQKSKQLQFLYDRERSINKELCKMQSEYSFLNSTICSELEDADRNQTIPFSGGDDDEVDDVPVLKNHVRFNMALQVKSASSETCNTTTPSVPMVMGDCREEEEEENDRIVDRILNEPLLMNTSDDEDGDMPN